MTSLLSLFLLVFRRKRPALDEARMLDEITHAWQMAAEMMERTCKREQRKECRCDEEFASATKLIVEVLDRFPESIAKRP